jgi:decaprenylphospho-beta-D-erythro-pentofuranosid-2-ulose 2-reductase
MRDALGSVQSLLVLGGTSEIGLATAAALARRRTRTIILACRDPAKGAAHAAALRAAGAARIETVRFDALDFASHARFVNDVFDRPEDIDAVLLAFGILDRNENALGVIETNFTGAASVLAPLARRMVRQGHGAIAVLSSVAGERVRKSNYVYGSSKAGIDGFASGLGDSLAGTGVHVMVVRPGFVHTKMTAGMKPPPLAAPPEEVAEAIVRGLARRADVVWAPARLRPLMAVVRHLPRPVFRRLPL